MRREEIPNVDALVVIVITDEEMEAMQPRNHELEEVEPGKFRASKEAQPTINGMWMNLANKYGFDPVSVVQTIDLPPGCFYARPIEKGMAIDAMHLTLDQVMHRTRIIR